MAKGRALKQRRTTKYFNVSSASVNGRLGFKVTIMAPDGTKPAVPDFFTDSRMAAKAADLTCLALGRKGPLNFSKQIHPQKVVNKERERLRQLGMLGPAEQQRTKAPDDHAQTVKQAQPQIPLQQAQPQKLQVQPGKKNRKQKKQQLECNKAQGEPDAAAVQPLPEPAKKDRKRKAAISDEPDATVTVTLAAVDQNVQQQQGAAEEASHPKRRKLQHPQEAATSPGAPAAGQKPRRSQHRSAADTALDQRTAAAEARAVPAGAASSVLAVVPAGAAPQLLPTGSAVQLGAPGNQAMVLQQLRSALAAHEASKRQLHVALQALEASEGQLAAVARAAGLM